MDTLAERSIEAHLRSAAKIEPDRLPRLKRLGADWAAAVEASLCGLYAAPLAVECVGLSSSAFAPGGTAFAAGFGAMVKSTQWRGLAVVLVDDAFTETVVEAMFGGSGRSQHPGRPATPLDRRFAAQALSAFVAAGARAFEPITPFDMAVERLLIGDVADKLAEILAPDSRAFVEVQFRVTVGLLSGTLRFALPERALSPHRRKLLVVPEAVSEVFDAGWTREITQGLGKADLEVRALLDEREITLGEVAAFRVGQTIVLDATMDSLIAMECEGQRLFRGRMGVSRDAYTLRIEERIDPAEEFIDDILAD